MSRGISTNSAPVSGIFAHRSIIAVNILAVLLSAFSASAAQPPIVSSLTAAPLVVVPDGIVGLEVNAYDPDCSGTCTSGCGQVVEAVGTAWSSTGGTFSNQQSGVNGSPYTATVDWQAPSIEGIYQIEVFLRDNGNFMCGGRQTVTATIDVEVNLNPNQPPAIDILTAVPSRVFAGQASTLTCSATDPEGDPVSYQWSTDLGAIVDLGGGAASFSSADIGMASVQCTAGDGNSSSSSTVAVAVTSASEEKTLTDGLKSPARLDIAPWGDVYVADPAAGGITVVNLFSGEQVYSLARRGINSVALDWNDNLLVAADGAASVIDRSGGLLLALDPGEQLGPIADVEVDHERQRYGVLYRKTARVVIFDASGFVVTAFGSTGDAPEQFKSPQGLAVTPDGNWVVADSVHGLVKIFNFKGQLLQAFGGLGAGPGEFVQLDDVEVDSTGRIFASDSFQDWVLVFDSAGVVREAVGTYGDEVGQLKTAAGIAVSAEWDRLLVASVNSASVQVFTTDSLVGAGPQPHPEVRSSDPAWNPDESTLAFGSTVLGSSSDPATLNLRNVGDAPLGLGQLAVSGGFVTESTCGSYLEPWDFCAITVIFQPARLGSYDGTFTIATSAGVGDVDIRLLGQGIAAPSASLEPGSLQFGEQTVGTASRILSATLRNLGGAPLDIVSVVSSDGFTAAYLCPESLPAGGLCAIDVQFVPFKEGNFGGSLTVATAQAGTHTIKLSGHGLPAKPTISIADIEVAEGAEALFVVTLSQVVESLVSVDYATVSDTAVEGKDFEPVGGRLLFEPGQTSLEIRVATTDDEMLETGREVFFVDLEAAVGASLAIFRAAATITDDEICLGPELLYDGGFEDLGQSLGDWRITAGEWKLDTEHPLHGEAALISLSSGFNEVVTDIDLSPYAAAVAAGDQQFVFSGFVSGASAIHSTVRVVVEYYGAQGRSPLEVFDTGPLSVPRAWKQIVDERIAPSGTASVRVRLIAETEEGNAGTVFFDGFSLASLGIPVLWIDSAVAYEGDEGPAELDFRVNLSCAWDQDVVFDFATSDATATAWVDYEAVAGSVSLPSGQTVGQLQVQVFGDLDDEQHETLFVDINNIAPHTLVSLNTRAYGEIVNDDFCARPASFWLEHPAEWPLQSLILGGTHLDHDAIGGMLRGASRDSAAALARQLIVAHFNLELGSDPAIWRQVDEADAVLAELWAGEASVITEQRAAEYEEMLADYNGGGCAP